MKKLNVIACVVAITAVCTVPAEANEWSLYGSARVATFYTSEDLGNELQLIEGTPTFISQDRTNVANQNTVRDLQWNLQGNSRIGAKVKGDRIDGRFEFAVKSDGSGGDVTTRLLYGVWKFAEGWGLKVGKDYTPIFFGWSKQVFDDDNELKKRGQADGSRRAQIAIEGGWLAGMWKFALIDQTTNTLGQPDSLTEKILPKFEASYEFFFTDAMSVAAFGGYQTYDIKYASPPPFIGQTNSQSVNSWMVGAGADLTFGPFYVRPQVSYYQNGAAAGWLNTSNDGLSYLPFTDQGFVNEINSIYGTDIQTVGGADVIDAKNLMAMLVLGFKPTETLGLEAGIGYVGYESDSYQGFKFKNNYFEYYINAVITLAKGVYIVPEVGYRDYGEAETDTPFPVTAPNVDLGGLFYAGAKWQIDF